MIRSQTVLSMALAVLALSPFAAAADFVVAPNGNDANPRTVEEPFATISRARDAVRAKIATGLKRPLIVQIRGGTYRITKPIVFGAADSGTPMNPITYTAAPGERPVISGGVAGDL